MRTDSCTREHGSVRLLARLPALAEAQCPGTSCQAHLGPPVVHENPLLAASQGEQGNMLDSKLGLGLTKRTEMNFVS